MSDKLPPFPDHGDLEMSTGRGLCDFCSPPGYGRWGYPCMSFPLPDPYGVYDKTFDRAPRSEGDSSTNAR